MVGVATHTVSAASSAMWAEQVPGDISIWANGMRARAQRLTHMPGGRMTLWEEKGIGMFKTSQASGFVSHRPLHKSLMIRLPLHLEAVEKSPRRLRVLFQGCSKIMAIALRRLRSILDALRGHSDAFGSNWTR